MSTANQIHANQLNARRSTGPKTALGKRISSRNATRHGFYATTVLLPDEDREEFVRFSRRLVLAYAPCGVLEEEQLRTIIETRWQLRRANLVDTELYMMYSIYDGEQRGVGTAFAQDSSSTDFTVYARSLSDAEIRQTAKAGRGGLTRAQALLERQARIARPGTLWIAVSGLLLIGVSIWRDASCRFLAGCSLLRDPAFVWVWVIVALGGGSTFWFTQRLAAAAQRADRERMDHFLTDLVSTGETHFERVADLLRRARDTLRQHPEMTHVEWHQWGRENGIPYNFSGLDGIG